MSNKINRDAIISEKILSEIIDMGIVWNTIQISIPELEEALRKQNK